MFPSLRTTGSLWTCCLSLSPVASICLHSLICSHFFPSLLAVTSVSHYLLSSLSLTTYRLSGTISRCLKFKRGKNWSPRQNGMPSSLLGLTCPNTQFNTYCSMLGSLWALPTWTRCSQALPLHRLPLSGARSPQIVATVLCAGGLGKVRQSDA